MFVLGKKQWPVNCSPSLAIAMKCAAPQDKNKCCFYVLLCALAWAKKNLVHVVLCSHHSGAHCSANVTTAEQRISLCWELNKSLIVQENIWNMQSFNNVKPVSLFKDFYSCAD